MGDLEEDVKELKRTVGKLEREMRVLKSLRDDDKKNHSTQRKHPMFGPCWWDVAGQATPDGVEKRIGSVAPLVDRKHRDVAVQAVVLLLVRTSGGRTDGQVVAETTARPSYTSVATQGTLVPTETRNGSSGGPGPPSGGRGLSL